MKILGIGTKHCSDAVYIGGIQRGDSKMEYGLYQLCKKYYEDNFKRFKLDDETKKDIFQSSLLALWENIRDRKLYVDDEVLKGKGGTPFTSTLTTYFMGIVNNKYREWLRKNPKLLPIDEKKEKQSDSCAEYNNINVFKDDDEIVDGIRVISQRVNRMSKQCNKILTLFYFEEKDYEEIMTLMPTFQSKDALKTAKYKCLKRLRESVIGTYC